MLYIFHGKNSDNFQKRQNKFIKIFFQWELYKDSSNCPFFLLSLEFHKNRLIGDKKSLE